MEKEIMALQQQISNAESTLGTRIRPLGNPHIGSVFDMPLNQIKQHFPMRYELYVDTLRGDPSVSPTMADRLQILNSLDTYVAEHYANWKNRTLFEHQMTAVEEIQAGLEQGIDKGYVQLPTGFGKTVIFSELVEAMDTKSLIVVPSQKLIEQTVEKLEQFASDLDVGRVYAKAKEFGRDVTVITYDSLLIGMEKGTINPEDYGVVILDEVHESLTDKRMSAVHKFDKSIVLGFTATPDYDTEKKTEKLLPHKYHEVSILEAVGMGALSDFSIVLAELDIDISNVRVLSNGEFDPIELEKVINFEAVSQATAKLYNELFKGKLGILFNSRIDFSSRMAESLKNAGIRAAAINSSVTLEEQKKIYEQITNGEIDILAGVKSIARGLDIPGLSFAMNQLPTTSKVSLLQKFGRILRIDEKNPNKEAVFVEFTFKDESGRRALSLVDILGTSHASKEGRSTRVSEKGNDVPEVPGGDGIQDIDIEGVRVIVDPEEVMRYMSVERTRPEATPEGTVSLSHFAHSLGVSETTLRAWIHDYRLENPAAIGIYEQKKYTFISPEIQSIARSAFAPMLEGREHKQELTTLGYRIVDKALRAELHASDLMILKMANELAQQNGKPEWIETAQYNQKKSSTRLAPEVIALLKEQLKLPDIPSNMISRAEIEQILGCHVTSDIMRELEERIKERLEADTSKSPTDFALNKRSTKGDRYKRYFDKGIVLDLKNRRDARNPSPAYYSLQDIADDFAVSRKTVSKILYEQVLPDSHEPDDKREIDLGGSIGVISTYSEQIIQRLREIVPPKGWLLADEIRQFVPVLKDVPIKRVRIHIKNILSRYPELMRSIGDERVTTFYSPQVIDILQQYTE